MPYATIPHDGTGHKLLNGALGTGTYEGSGRKQERGAAMDIQFNNPVKFKLCVTDQGNFQIRRGRGGVDITPTTVMLFHVYYRLVHSHWLTTRRKVC